MNDTITIMGNLAADPVQRFIGNGASVTSFRVASSQRHLDKKSGKWVDGQPNWYQVSAFRALGEHAFASLHKGERVIVTGRLSVRHWENDKGKGVSVEIEADAVGHDLLWGTTQYTRVERSDQWQIAGSEASGTTEGSAESSGAQTGEWATTEPGQGSVDAGARDWGGAPTGGTLQTTAPAPQEPDRELVDAPF